jgi:hypothetical protein
MKNLRAYSLVTLVTSSLLVAACTASSTSTSDPTARTGAVQSAFSQPTGTVGAASAELVISHSQSVPDLETLTGYLGAVPGLGGLSAALGVQGLPGGLPGLPGASCLGGASTSGTVDLSCSSGGAATGSASFEVDASSGSGSAVSDVSITLTGACTGGTCFDGTLAIHSAAASSGAAVVIDADVEVTRSGATDHVHFGLQAGAVGQAGKVDLAVFDDAGLSYVLDVAAGAGSGSVSLQGVNGTFSCTYDAGGGTGSCSGSASFSW